MPGPKLYSATSHLGGIAPAEFHDATRNAQRFLASAFDTVEDLLTALDIVRAYRKLDEGKGSKGALASNEQDLLRAGLAFAGAGLDSSLQQLVRDTLPLLLDIPNSPAADELLSFSTRRITVAQAVDPGAIAALLLTDRPRDVLLNDFVDELTGSSIQSVAAVHRIATVLGVPTKHALRNAVTNLRPSFEARNQIAHELDLQVPLGHGDRQKRSRTMTQTIPMIHALLQVPQLLINEVVSSLGQFD